MQPTSQNQGNKNIRFMSLGKQKNWDIFSSSLKAALLLFMFVYLFACSLKLSSFVCFSLFLSICFPVCQSLCLSLFPCLSFLDISILVCQVNLNLSTCSLRNASSQGCFLGVFFCIFPKGILNLFQTCPHEYRPARCLFTGHSRIEFQDIHCGV